MFWWWQLLLGSESCVIICSHTYKSFEMLSNMLQLLQSKLTLPSNKV
jgi:hypothetical protein